MLPPAPARDATYWLLSDPDSFLTKASIRTELEDIGYEPKKSASRVDLDALLRHARTDHVCYNKCTLEELKGYALNRGLISKKANSGHARLVRLLLIADMNPTFTRFIDLPPQLRVRIYELYMADFTTKSLRHPIDPPLTRTNRLLRSEALPIFYQQCTFCIEIEIDAEPHPRRQLLQVQRSSKAFIRALSSLKIRYMRQLEIKFHITISLAWGRCRAITAHITFNQAKDSYSLSFSLCQSSSRGTYATDSAAIEAKLRSVLDHAVGRIGLDKLQADDLVKLDSTEQDLFQAVLSDMER